MDNNTGYKSTLFSAISIIKGRVQEYGKRVHANNWVSPFHLHRNWVFATNSDFLNYESNNLSLKYQRFTTLGCKDKRIRKFLFLANTQFLWFSLRYPATTALDLKMLKCKRKKDFKLNKDDYSAFCTKPPIDNKKYRISFWFVLSHIFGICPLSL